MIMNDTTIRRGFVDVPDGQVHYRESGNDSGRPFVLLHASPGSGLMLKPLLSGMGRHRRTIALDTRGNGDSDPLPGTPEIADFATATWDVIDALGIGDCDLFGTHTGASIALEAAIQKPHRVGHLILDSMALWSSDRQGAHIANNSPAVAPDRMGGQLNWAWHYCRDQYLFSPWYEPKEQNRRHIDMPSAEKLHAFVVEVLKALTTYHMSYSAAARYSKKERLPLVTVPTLVSSCPTDPLIQYIDEVQQLVSGSRLAIIEDPETETGAAAAARVYEDFLSGAVS